VCWVSLSLSYHTVNIIITNVVVLSGVQVASVRL